MVELLSGDTHLTMFEFTDPEGSPARGGAVHGAEKEFEHGLLAEGVGDDPRSSRGHALRRRRSSTNRCSRRIIVRIARAMGDWHSQVCDAVLEAVDGAGGRPRQFGLIFGDHTTGEIVGDLIVVFWHRDRLKAARSSAVSRGGDFDHTASVARSSRAFSCQELESIRLLYDCGFR